MHHIHAVPRSVNGTFLLQLASDLTATDKGSRSCSRALDQNTVVVAEEQEGVVHLLSMFSHHVLGLELRCLIEPVQNRVHTVQS